jgi:putative phosphoesterase
MDPTPPVTIAILSDTHGLLRPELLTALSGCDHILHAGDVGSAQVMDRLSDIAPLTAVRGNMDYGSWSNALAAREMVEIAGRCFYLLHDLHHLDLDPAAAGIHMVVSGHTHQPEITTTDGVIFLNPGSCGPRRFTYPVTFARVRIAAGRLRPRIVDLQG